METTQNTDTVVASSKYRSHTPKQCIAEGNQYSTSTNTNRLEKIRISLMAYRNATHFVPGPLSYRTERETNTKSGKNQSEEVIPRNLAKNRKDMWAQEHQLEVLSFST